MIHPDLRVFGEGRRPAPRPLVDFPPVTAMIDQVGKSGRATPTERALH